MTMARVRTRPVPVKPVTYCGCCAGWRVIWCPDCFGFSGCKKCRHSFTVPCPLCSGGTKEPIRW